MRPTNETFHYYESDSADFRSQIRELEALGYRPERHTVFHAKVDDINFYMKGGKIKKIVIDPDRKHPAQGFAALKALLAEKPFEFE